MVSNGMDAPGQNGIECARVESARPTTTNEGSVRNKGNSGTSIRVVEAEEGTPLSLRLIKARNSGVGSGAKAQMKGVESDPLSGDANAMLGMTYSAAGRYTGAVEASERAVELDLDSFLARCSLQWALRFSRR
jgi:hypothetical protein